LKISAVVLGAVASICSKRIVETEIEDEIDAFGLLTPVIITSSIFAPVVSSF